MITQNGYNEIGSTANHRKGFGILFDRHVRHATGLNEKTLEQKPCIQYGHLLLFEKFSCQRSR